MRGEHLLQLPNLVFGTSPQNARNKFGHHHSGSWKDRLPEVKEDVAYLEALIKKHGGEDKPYRKFPGEDAPFETPRVEHTVPAAADAGKDLSLTAKVLARTPIDRVLLHYRPLNQRADWKEIAMTAGNDGRFTAAIPSRDITAKFDLQYYFEVLYQGGGGRMWPSWQDGMPYIIVPTKP